MTDLFSEHPVPRLLESYALEDLPESDLSAIEEHLLVCERCRQVVAELDVFAPTLRGWGRKRTSAAFVHETDDGPIRLELRALPDAKWAARFWGEALEGSAVFPSVREAYAHLRDVFSEMYPDHLCNQGCGAPD
ncbi:MAG TPA: zf-HC2 domain-containing protein [Bryobacteraceae bacterium]|nr:zf-HC2 domain-containing protein [Bryobacteraceae bacterium]